MVGLQASYFRRIYKGLLLDLMLTVVSPVVIIILGYLVSGQMEAAGLAVEALSSADAARFPSIVTRLMYAYLVLQYCLAALCALMVVSALGAAESCSPCFHRSRQWFVALMVLNAVAMVSRIAYVLMDNDPAFSVWIEKLHLIAELFLLGVRGAALCLLLRGEKDVLASIGDTGAAERAFALSKRCAVSFLVLGTITAIDDFIDLFFTLPDLGALVIVILHGLALIYNGIVYAQIILRTRETARLVAYLSEEVIA